MSNRTIDNPRKAGTLATLPPTGIIGDYANIEDAVEAMKADLMESLKDLDLSFLAQRIGK